MPKEHRTINKLITPIHLVLAFWAPHPRDVSMHFDNPFPCKSDLSPIQQRDNGFQLINLAPKNPFSSIIQARGGNPSVIRRASGIVASTSSFRLSAIIPSFYLDHGKPAQTSTRAVNFAQTQKGRCTKSSHHRRRDKTNDKPMQSISVLVYDFLEESSY